MKQDPSSFQPFVPGLLVLAALSLYSLIRAPFTSEEAAFLTRAQISPSGPLLASHTPLYLLLLGLWSRAGESPVWLRMLPFLSGLLCLPLAQRVIRGLGGRRAAPGALLLLGASPLLVIQASRLSPGAIGLLAALPCFACFLEFLRTGEGRWVAAWTAAVIIAWGIHAGLFWVVGVEGLAMLLYWKRYRVRQPVWWAVQIPLAALFLWYSGPALRSFLVGRLPAVLDAPSGTDLAAMLVRAGTALSLSKGWTGTLFLLLPLLSGLWVCRDGRRDPRHGLLLLIFLFSGSAYLLVLPSDAFLLIFLVCWCTLASIGLRHFSRWARQAAWGAVGVVYLWSYWNLLR